MLITREKSFVGRFKCMASPCEILLDCDDEPEARHLAELAEAEARRIEDKFSRYREDNIVFQINLGGRIEVDAETARLLDFADECYRLSDGAFDITSGVLRQAWNFAPGARIPAQSEIETLLPRIGWSRIQWEKPWLQVPAGMEIDFGGIGKEYAVDRIAVILSAETPSSFLVNLGGDCFANAPLRDDSAWLTGIENPDRPGDASAVIQLRQGALATSGDVFRHILHDGVRYGHILDPRSGWPNTESPRSVTVAAPTCTEAGLLSTLAMLQGTDAEAFLDTQAVRYWCHR